MALRFSQVEAACGEVIYATDPFLNTSLSRRSCS